MQSVGGQKKLLRALLIQTENYLKTKLANGITLTLDA